MDAAAVNAFEDVMTRWFKVQKEHPGIYAGEKPRATDYRFKTDIEVWHANEIERRVRREIERTI